MAHLAIVGSGITGALSAYFLKLRIPQINITILEKSRGTGGRMCTSRSTKNSSCTADLGAQYITKTEKLPKTHQSCYESLINAGLLKKLDGHVEGMHKFRDPVQHFVCPNGSGSLAKHFLEKSGAEVCFGQRVTEITSSADNKWTVKLENSSERIFDGVIFTIPVPQVLQIGIKTNDKLDESTIEKLKKVKYNSRYALAHFYAGAEPLSTHPYSAKYFDNDMIRFVSFDNVKRGEENVLPSVVVHSTKEFGKKHVEESSDQILPILSEELNKLVPGLPQPSDTKILKWRYSQVETPFPGEPGCVVLSSKPLLVCGGDGFSKSSFEGCLFSAERVADTIVSHLT